MSTDQVLRSIYFNVGHESGFSSAQKLYDCARRQLPGLSRAVVDDWLRNETVYTLHRAARRNFVRNPIITHCIGEWCQADLADMQCYSGYNDGYKHLLTFIDVFSKRATAIPLKSKSMSEVAKAFETIFSDFICFNLLTDRGKEFKNQAVAAVMQKYGVRLRFSYNEAIKASCAERFNRTLKEKMHRYFTANGTRCYIDVLPKLLQAYNNTVHSSTGHRPVDVGVENSSAVYRKLYGNKASESTEKPYLRVGDTVRIRYHLTAMDKSYFPTFSDQTFTVFRVVTGQPRVMYRLENWEGDVLDRKYYHEDLQKIGKNVRYRIERVLKRRGNKSLVKWTGYPHGANSWIQHMAMPHEA